MNRDILSSPANALELRSIFYTIQGLTVLDNVSLSMSVGDRLGIRGFNGAGKSTLLRVLGGWNRPQSGVVEILGVDVTCWPTHRRYALGMREVPQLPQLSAELTGHEILSVAHMAAARSGGGGIKLLAAQPAKSLVDVLALELPTGQLSFGSCKMLAIQAAFTSNPKVLLLDEPTVGLDELQKRRLVDILCDLPVDISTIIVEHNISFLNQVCNRQMELRQGKLWS